MSHNERWKRGIPCPFLRERQCSIYPARPAPCRTYFSTSRAACLRSWAQRKKTGSEIENITGPSTIAAMIVCGIDYALIEAGLQVAYGELAAMTAVACRPLAIEAWLSGETVFPEDERSATYRDAVRTLYDHASATGDLERGKPRR